MKRVRLLPIVIFAALALLVFKGIGIATNGGYVLIGTTAAMAQQGAETASPGASDMVAADTSPVLTDTAPSMAAKPEVASSMPPSSGAAVQPSSPAPAAGASGESAMASGAGAAQPSSSAAMPGPDASSAPAAAEACPESPPSASSAAPGDMNDRIGHALVNGCPPPAAAVNENGDVLPTTKDGNGRIVPLQVAEGDDSQDAILSHLTERRAELDKRQADLDMREALVAAAEQKLDDRSQALADLEAQIKTLVDQKQAAEDASFKAVVSMYETMKPKDAAKIFDTLDIDVLLKIARAMNPRNMSPILAAMSALPAQQLTLGLASVTPVTTVPVAGSKAALPQIVGQ